MILFSVKLKHSSETKRNGEISTQKTIKSCQPCQQTVSSNPEEDLLPTAAPPLAGYRNIGLLEILHNAIH